MDATELLLAQAVQRWRGSKARLSKKERQRARKLAKRSSVRWICLKPPEKLKADEEAVVVSCQELQAEQLLEEPLVQLDVGAPVEVLQTRHLLETGLGESEFEPVLVSAGYLVGQEDFEEGGMIQLLASGQGQPFRQGGGHLAQLEPLEQFGQIGVLQGDTVSCLHR